MRKKRILRVKQQTVRTQEPRLMNDIINELLNGQTPFAQARRHRSGRAWTSQAGAGSAGSGCTHSGQAGTGSAYADTESAYAGLESAYAGLESAGAGRTWTGLYPNTELGADLKLVTQKQGRMELGEYLDGMITRDGEDHFIFVENATEQRKAERRNPTIFSGQWINVKRRADGTVYPTFKRTKRIGAGELGDYAVSTTCELLMVAGKHEAAMALAEVEGFDLSELFASDGGLGEEEDFGEE